MISKTRMLALIKDLRSKEVDAGLAEKPELLAARDKKGRNWLHLCFRRWLRSSARRTWTLWLAARHLDGAEDRAGVDAEVEWLRGGSGRREILIGVP